jgi:hypothetical protein
MINLLLIMLFSGCLTNKKQLDIARTEIIGQCLDRIEEKLQNSGCPNIEYFKSQGVLVFRCKKPDVHRENFWDTWWFRLTSSILEWPEDKIQEVEEHTICIDGRFRLEAYPPEDK